MLQLVPWDVGVVYQLCLKCGEVYIGQRDGVLTLASENTNNLWRPLEAIMPICQLIATYVDVYLFICLFTGYCRPT